MKIPAKSALVASAATLMVVGLTAGTGLAGTVRGYSDDSSPAINLSTANLSLQTSPRLNEEGAPFYHQSGRVRQVIQVVADALGMEAQDVAALMKEGKTLAQVITDNEGDVDGIVDTLVDRLREKVQEKVDSGDITQEQMDQRMDQAEERINALLNGERPAGMHGKKGGARSFDGRFSERARRANRGFASKGGDFQNRFWGGSALAGDSALKSGRFAGQTANRTENRQTWLQNAVDSGRITQEQMNQRLDQLQERRPDGLSRNRFASEFDRTIGGR